MAHERRLGKGHSSLPQELRAGFSEEVTSEPREKGIGVCEQGKGKEPGANTGFGQLRVIQCGCGVGRAETQSPRDNGAGFQQGSQGRITYGWEIRVRHESKGKSSRLLALPRRRGGGRVGEGSGFGHRDSERLVGHLGGDPT